MILQF